MYNIFLFFFFTALKNVDSSDLSCSPTGIMPVVSHEVRVLPGIFKDFLCVSRECRSCGPGGVRG